MRKAMVREGNTHTKIHTQKYINIQNTKTLTYTLNKKMGTYGNAKSAGTGGIRRAFQGRASRLSIHEYRGVSTHTHAPTHTHT